MGPTGASAAGSDTASGRTLEGTPLDHQRRLLACPHRSTLAGSARRVRDLADRLRAASPLVRGRNLGTDPGRPARRMRSGRGRGLDRGDRLHRRARPSVCRRARRAQPKDIPPERLAPAQLSSPARPPPRPLQSDAGREPAGNRPGKGHAPDREGLGHSRGGLTSKIHLLRTDAAGSLARVTSAGHRHDSLAFEPLMDRLRIRLRPGPGRPRTPPARLLGDKAYSNATIRSHLRRRHIKTTIPEPTRNRKARGSQGGRPPAFDPVSYKDRNVAERAINKLKEFRAVATARQTGLHRRGTVDVAAIRIWLCDPVP